MSPRGGYRKPKNPRAGGGPGRFATRSDGLQPIRTEGLDDPSTQYGDVQRNIEAQKIVPLRKAAKPTVATPLSRDELANAPIPLDTIIDRPSDRPLEPLSEGLPIGPGAGPEVLPTPPQDDREAVLQWAAAQGNADAAEMLASLRTERFAPTDMGMPQDLPPAPKEDLEAEF